MPVDTTIDNAPPIIRHEVRGTIGVGEISIAMRQSIENPTLNVLCVLTKAILSPELKECVEPTRRLMRLNKRRLPQTKHAFVVESRIEHALVESWLSTLSPPWPWVIFQDVGTAMDWLSKSDAW